MQELITNSYTNVWGGALSVTVIIVLGIELTTQVQILDEGCISLRTYALQKDMLPSVLQLAIGK